MNGGTMNRFALIGSGTAAQLYAKAIARGVPGEFAGVHDVNTASAQQLLDQLGGKFYPSLDALADDKSVDAVVIASPTATHIDIAQRLLASGKHLLIEKPVAESVADIEQLSSAAERAGMICMPAHNYIYNPAMARAKRLMDNGALGKLASIWMLYNIFHDEVTAAKYGGVTREVAIHHVYTLLYLLGRPTRISAVQSHVHYEQLSCEDQVMLLCEMPGGAIANLWVSFAASDNSSAPWSVAYKFLGTEGAVHFNWNDANFNDNGGPAWGIPDYVDSFWDELNFFLGAAIAEKSAPLSSLRDARDALRIIEAAERSVAADSAFQTIAYD